MRRHYRRGHRRHRRNPDILSNPSGLVRQVQSDAVAGAWVAGGITGTAILADKYVTPAIHRFANVTSEIAGKLISFGSRAAVAVFGSGILNSVDRRGAELARLGGLGYAASALLAIPFPTFSIGVQVPSNFNFQGLLGQTPAQPALPAGMAGSPVPTPPPVQSPYSTVEM